MGEKNLILIFSRGAQQEKRQFVGGNNPFSLSAGK